MSKQQSVEVGKQSTEAPNHTPKSNRYKKSYKKWQWYDFMVGDIVLGIFKERMTGFTIEAECTVVDVYGHKWDNRGNIFVRIDRFRNSEVPKEYEDLVGHIVELVTETYGGYGFIWWSSIYAMFKGLLVPAGPS